MRMDMIHTKTYKQEVFKYERLAVVLFAGMLGTLPIGHFILLPGLMYLSNREDRTQYLALASFVAGSVVNGWLLALIQLAMLLLWNACTQLANFSTRNQMTWIACISAVISLIIGWLSGYPLPYILIFLVLQYAGFELLRRDFYRDREMMMTFAIGITLITIVVVLQNYVTQSLSLAIISGLLLYLSSILSTKKTLYLIVLSYFCYMNPNNFMHTSDAVIVEQALLFSVAPLLIVMCLPNSKIKRWIAYIVIVIMLYTTTKQLTDLMYVAMTSILILFTKKENETVFDSHVPLYLRYHAKENKQTIPQTQTNTLLHKFAKIFSELAKRNSSLQILESVSAAFSLCEEELRSTYLKEQDMKQRVEEVLRAYSFPVTRITVEKHEVILIHLWISKLHPSELEATIVPLLSNAIGLPFHILEHHKAGLFDSFHRITLSSEKGLSILYDQIQKPIDGECGDAILVKAWHETMHFMISDGMGSGTNARTQSTFVLSMMEQFMEANVPMKTSIKLVNQLAMLQNDERYATLDVLSIDRFKKEALLYKSGSMQTYLLRGNQVYSFFSSSLPLGIITRVNPEYYSIPLKEGDIILMVSDGGDHEKMKEWLKQCSQVHASKMLRALYEKRINETIDDDVSMLLIRMKNGVI